MASDLSQLDLLVIQIDGIHIAEDLVLLAAVGVNGAGDKHPLGVIEGATENATVVQALLDNLIERGLDPKVCRLFIIDGAKALTKAIRKTFGRHTPIQRCQVHKARNILERLPKPLHASVRKALRQAWELDDADQAERLIKNLGQNSFVSNVGSDTSYVPPRDLEINAVYTWSVTAALPRSGQASVVPSSLTFVVEDPMQPIAITDMFPAFPNPFPGLVTNVACIWFDLKNPSAVELDVYSLRGIHVRRLVPNDQFSGTLASGRYGRGRTELAEGCDGRFAWDGTDDRGNTVPEGVYIIRFRGDGVQRTRKVVFRGRR